MTSIIPFWTNNTYYLVNELNFIPCRNCSIEKNLNRITRFILITSIIISAIIKTTTPLYLGLFIITLIAILYFLSTNQMNTFKDNFSNLNNKSLGYDDQLYLLNTPNNPTYVNDPTAFYNGPSPYQDPYLNYGLGPQDYRIKQSLLNTPIENLMSKPILRNPTNNNPFMNVMPLDYGAPPIYDNYNHYEKYNYPTKESQEIRSDITNNFNKNLFQNASGLLWERNNSQREYISQPVGDVPNNQTEFAEWLYGNQYGNCKSGSIYGRHGFKYTDDSLLCNGFNVATPTNQGLINGNLMSSVDQSSGLYE